MGCFHQISPLKGQRTEQKWGEECKSQRELEYSKETRASKHNLTSACMNSETGSAHRDFVGLYQMGVLGLREVDIGSIPNPEANSNQ